MYHAELHDAEPEQEFEDTDNETDFTDPESSALSMEDDETETTSSGRECQRAPIDDGIEPDEDFATNEDMDRLDIKTRWVWNGWLQDASVNLLSAEGGMGKSRFMSDLCRRVHVGHPWPDNSEMAECVGKYIVMWVAGDRNHAEIASMSKAFGFGERICYSGTKRFPTSEVTLDKPEDFERLYRRVKAAKPMFLVVDTVGGATSLNMAKQEEARAFFSPLCELANNLAVCVIVITHLNAQKQTLGRRAEERVRCVIRLSAENKLPMAPRRLEVVKSNGLFPEPLGMTLHERGSNYDCAVPESPEDRDTGDTNSSKSNKKSPKTDACAIWLKQRLQSPTLLTTILAEAVSKQMPRGTVYKAKDKLGIVQSVGKQQTWSLPTR